MKYFALVIWSAFVSAICFAQKQFEGTIIYNFHENDKNTDAELTAMFGRAGIKLKFREKNDYDKEVILINLDSGIVYTLNTDDKTYKSKDLVEKKKSSQQISDKIIAGYKTRAIDISNTTTLGNLGSLFMGGQVILYRSDSLFYFLPEKYSANPELIIVNDHHIVLGADMITGRYEDYEMNDTIDKYVRTIVNIEAKEIKWQSFDEKEFQIPADYKKSSYEYFPDSTITDTAMVMDSFPPKPDKPLQKAKPKTNPKPKTKTVPKKDMRKPD